MGSHRFSTALCVDVFYVRLNSFATIFTVITRAPSAINATQLQFLHMHTHYTAETQPSHTSFFCFGICVCSRIADNCGAIVKLALMHTGATAFAAAAARVAAMAAAGASSEFALPPLPPPARSSLGSSDGQRGTNRLLIL